MNTPVYNPSIVDDAAKALYNFCTKFNTRSHDAQVRLLGYLHGNMGAKLRIEPVETCSTRDINRWKKLAKEVKCKILNINVNAAEGHVDICTEYNPPTSLLKGTEWQNLLLPVLILIIVMKYTGALQTITGYQI